MDESTQWVKVDPDGLAEGQVMTVVAGERALCLTRTAEGYGALDNRCPHQGGPLGDGQIEDGWLICPWHAYQYGPCDGKPPPGFSDAATAYAIEERHDGLWVQVPVEAEDPSLMDQLVGTLCDWGLDAVFGMVGHSNLGLADAIRRAAGAGRLTYVGIRHEGAAAFAASGYAKLTGRPGGLLLHCRARCHEPADRAVGRQGRPGAGAGADRSGPDAGARPGRLPGGSALRGVLRCGRVDPDGPEARQRHRVGGAGHEARHRAARRRPPRVPRRGAGAARGGRCPGPAPAGSGGGKRDRPAGGGAGPRGRAAVGGGAAGHHLRERRPPVPGRDPSLCRADLCAGHHHLQGQGDRARRPSAGLRSPRPVGHPGGVTHHAAGRLPAGAGRLVLQPHVDRHLGADDPGRPRPDDPRQVPSGGGAAVGRHRPNVGVAGRRAGAGGAAGAAGGGGAALGPVAHGEGPPGDADRSSGPTPSRDGLRRAVGDLPRGCRDRRRRRKQHLFVRALLRVPGPPGRADVRLGSIGFGLPAAIGASVAVRREGPRSDGTVRKVVSISGDGGLGQYLADFTTAVKYRFPLTHIVLNNGELAKISREQLGAIRPVWETNLVNPDFCEYARLCGGAGFSVRRPEELQPALKAALAHADGPSLVEIHSSSQDV